MGLYQILFMKKAAYHVVNETVEYAKAEKGAGVAGFVNAVLRRAIREKDALAAALPPDPVARMSIEYSFPEWLAARWNKRFGTEAARGLLANLNKSPSFALRVDARKITREEAAGMIAGLGIVVEKGRFAPQALRIDKIGPLIESGLLKSTSSACRMRHRNWRGSQSRRPPATLSSTHARGRGRRRARSGRHGPRRASLRWT